MKSTITDYSLLLSSLVLTFSLTKKARLLKKPPLSDIKEDKYNFGRRYKMYEGNKKEISLRDLCDQFIHADIFSQFIPMTEGSLGIYFASDKIKNQGLFYIQMYEIARILRSIAKSCNISIQVKYDEEKSVFKFSEI